MTEPTADGEGAAAGAGDLVRLGARLGAGYLRHGRAFDPGEAGCRWARELLARDGGSSIHVELAGRRLEVIADRALSDRVLAAHPAAPGCPPGALKIGGMSFLADRALTIAQGDAWTRLRSFNEHVLGTGVAHPYAQAFLERVRGAFAEPVRNREDIGGAMGRAMVALVIGEGLPGEEPDPAAEATALFGVVQSPLRRKLLGFHYRRRRDRLYALLARRWAAAGEADHTLLSLARLSAAAADRDELLQQVPHWMFTFTGSGTDLLARTLALVTARPDVRRRVLDEVSAAGPLDRAESIEQLPYLAACLHETGRLFPPVTRTFHGPAATGPDGSGANADGSAAETVHWFPLLQRDDALGPTVHAFCPERWLEADRDAAAAASNLFLRGPRACPGMDLILFVCRAALARQVAELGVTARSPLLARDPLPITFPAREARFTPSEPLP